MFVVTGADGRTGSVVASRLLERGRKVRVIVHSADKGLAWRKRGAEAVAGSLDDRSMLSRAFADVEGAYLLLPQDMRSVDLVANLRRIADALVEAAKTARARHAVLLSSTGAQHATGTGPVQTLHYAEGALRASGLAATIVRASYFMDNFASMLPAMRQEGVLPSFGDPDVRFPMVATRDIGEVAAGALLDPPGASETIELSGPAEYSVADAAAAFSQALGKPVNAVGVPEDQMVPALMRAGMSQNYADLFREMSVAMGRGLLAFEGAPGTRAARGKTTLQEAIGRMVSSVPA